jgi:branched-chain amino acid aminotransferase
MSAHTFLLTPDGSLTLTQFNGPGLDAVSLHLPDGIYTTLRTYERDHILGLSAHLQRLVDSHFKLNKPRPIDLSKIRLALRQIIEQENQTAIRLRITTPFDSPDVYLSVEPFASYPPEFYSHGVQCATSHLERATPEAKHTSFIAPSRGEKAQADPDIHEKLMVNDQGEILEGFSSNFYAVLNGKLWTANEGVLAGVTRRVVLGEAEGRIPIELKPITVNDLPAVREAFITSSGREVMPVRQIDEVLIPSPGELTRVLMLRYRDHILRDAERP